MADREKLIELLSVNTCPNAICNFCEHFRNGSACEKHKKEVVANHLIANGVTVRERGRWEDVRGIPSVNRKDVPIVKCSKCEIYFCDLINNHHYMYHFCPNCGADMRGEEDG